MIFPDRGKKQGRICMTSGLYPPVFASYLRLRFSVFLIALLSLPSLAAGKTKHTVGKVWYSYNTVKIYVEPAYPGSDPSFRYNSIGDNRFYIDIFNSRVTSSLNTTINLDDVKMLRRAQYDPTTSRIVVQFNKSGIRPRVKYVNSSKPYILVSWNSGSATTSIKKFKILIDPGHGGVHPGSVGPVMKLKEKDVTLDIAIKLARLYSKRDDVEVRLTRTTDKHLNRNRNLDLMTRKKMAQNWKPDIFISIHVNGNRDRNLNQTEIYYYDYKSLSLARTVRDNLISRLNRNDGEVRRKRFAVIRNNPATYGAVLVESCYISSVRGEKKLSQKDYRIAIAEGLRNSINAFMKSINNANN